MNPRTYVQGSPGKLCIGLDVGNQSGGGLQRLVLLFEKANQFEVGQVGQLHNVTKPYKTGNSANLTNLTNHFSMFQSAVVFHLRVASKAKQ